MTNEIDNWQILLKTLNLIVIYERPSLTQLLHGKVLRSLILLLLETENPNNSHLLPVVQNKIDIMFITIHISLSRKS